MLVYFGTFLEFFEFVLFATLFPVLSKSFSSSFSSDEIATLNYILFWVGFLARPLGALILSPIGDLHNRRSILIVSIVGMAFSTMFMGCIPIFVSPFIVISCIVVLRLLQGFFTGVEYSSSTIYLFESIKDPLQRKISVVYMGVMAVLGTSLAYFVAALCQLELLSTINFWRAIFMFTGFIGLWVGGLRFTRLPKDFDNITQKKEQEDKVQPKFTILKNAFLSFFIVGMSYAPFYYITTFLNIYGVVLNTQNPLNMFVINAGICLLYAFVIFFITKGFNQKLLTKKYVSTYFMVFISAIFPLSYVIFHNENIFAIAFCQVALIVLSQLIVSNVIGEVPGLFKKNIRVRSYTLVQTLSASILGGAGPLICHMLVIHFGDKSFAALYPMGVSLIAFFCYRGLFKNKASFD